MLIGTVFAISSSHSVGFCTVYCTKSATLKADSFVCLGKLTDQHCLFETMAGRCSAANYI